VGFLALHYNIHSHGPEERWSGQLDAIGDSLQNQPPVQSNGKIDQRREEQ